MQPIVSPAASPMTLRDRKKATAGSTTTATSGRTAPPSAKLIAQLEAESEIDNKMKVRVKAEDEPLVVPKKLPRVILHVRAPPGHPEYNDTPK